MRKLLVWMMLVVLAGDAQAQTDFSLENYFLPKNVNYKTSVPKPRDIIGHEVGEWHVTHDRLVQYMKALAAARPDRIKLQVTGKTYEGREQLLLIFSSPANINNLETIRQKHLQYSHPEPGFKVNANDPLVVCMGYSIHGNESSGSNASMIAAYYLAAAEGPAIDDLLSNTIILLDPSFNPDGLNRFATWANQHKSATLVTDPQSREFSEVWPGGRFNHYWFDLNRDWLPAVHVESRNKLQYFHDWRPNILTDHHEMGSNSSFFFQPGVPSRVNPLTPARNQELTAAVGQYHARFLDSIGSFYYTKEGYDDYYYGKGSTFPDIHGAVGILFEQASSRGHAQQTSNGILQFPFTIRNQFTTTLSTLEAARNLRKEFLQYQLDAYTSALQEGASSANGAYVFGDKFDTERVRLFAEMLVRQQVQVYFIQKELNIKGQLFKPGSAFAVPMKQPQYRLIRAVFDEFHTFKDSLFYDITAWTMPLAFGLDCTTIQPNESSVNWNTPLTMQQVAKSSEPFNVQQGAYAYLLDWHQFLAPAALYEMQQKSILCKVASRPFTMQASGGVQHFSAGTIIIPVAQQTMSHDALMNNLRSIHEKFGVGIQSTKSGSVINGSDFGSNSVRTISKMNAAMLVGSGVSATDAGEVWHLFDQRMHIPLTQLPTENFNRIDLSKYTVLIMVSGNYNMIDKNKLRNWISSGGVLIACEDAVQWCAQQELARVEFNRPGRTAGSENAAYADRDEISGARRMNGAVVRASLDTTHPLGYGYYKPYIDLLKTNSVFMQPSAQMFGSPLQYGKSPLKSGYIQSDNYAALKETASVTVQSVGGGSIILMADNPNFRAFWLGGTKLFMNAVFFGDLIR